MSFPDDTRPETRKYVVASWVLRIGSPALTLFSVLVLTLAWDELGSDNPWLDIVTWLVIVGAFGGVASIFVDRAKKNADARWALRETQKRTDALGARLLD